MIKSKSYTMLINLVTFIVITTFLCQNIVWADEILSRNFLAAESRLTPFFEKYGLDIRDIGKIVMAVSKLKRIIYEEAQGDVEREIKSLNDYLLDRKIRIDGISEYVFRCSKRKIRYAIFNFEENGVVIKALFLGEQQNLTTEELEEIGVTNEEKHHLDCPGLENVWFICAKGKTPDERVEQIKRLYHKEMTKRKLFGKVTREGIYLSSEIEHIFEIMKSLDLPKGKKFIDLGSGDGMVAIIASIFGLNVTAYEVDNELFHFGLDMERQILGRNGNVDFRDKNFLEDPNLNLTEYDVIYYYTAGSEDEDRVFMKIVSEVRNDSLLVVYGGRPDPDFMWWPCIDIGCAHVFYRPNGNPPVIKKPQNVPRGTPATLLQYMYKHNIFSNNSKTSGQLAGQRGGNDSRRTIQRELRVLQDVGLVQSDKRKGYYLADWFKIIDIEEIIKECPELGNPSPTNEQKREIADKIRNMRYREIRSDQSERAVPISMESFVEQYQGTTDANSLLSLLLSYYHMDDLDIKVCVNRGILGMRGCGVTSKAGPKRYEISLTGVDGVYLQYLLFHEFLHIYLEEKGLTFTWKTSNERIANYLFNLKNLINDYLIEKENERIFGNTYVYITKDTRDRDVRGQFMSLGTEDNVEVFLLALTCKAVTSIYPELSDSFSAQLISDRGITVRPLDKIMEALGSLSITSTFGDYAHGVSDIHSLLTGDTLNFKGSTIVVNSRQVLKFCRQIDDLIGQIKTVLARAMRFGGTEEGNRHDNSEQKLMAKIQEISQSFGGQAILTYLDIRGIKKYRYLSSRAISIQDLPLGYPVSLRKSVPWDITETILGRGPQHINVRLPEVDILLVSHFRNGQRGVVRLGFLDDGRPVAIKTYYTYSKNSDNRLIEYDYKDAVFAGLLGIGPRVHGMFIDETGRESIVMDIVPGDFPEAVRYFITSETIKDFREINMRLLKRGKSMAFDIQYFITPEGRIQILDPEGICDAPQGFDEYNAIFINRLVYLLSLADEEVQIQTMEEIIETGDALLLSHLEGEIDSPSNLNFRDRSNLEDLAVLKRNIDAVKRKLTKKGTPATLLRYMCANRIFSDNPKKSKEMARQRGGNDSIRTIQRELRVLRAVGLVERNRVGYYLPDWLRNVDPEDIIIENPELNIPNPSDEQISSVVERVVRLRRGCISGLPSLIQNESGIAGTDDDKLIVVCIAKYVIDNFKIVALQKRFPVRYDQFNSVLARKDLEGFLSKIAIKGNFIESFGDLIIFLMKSRGEEGLSILKEMIDKLISPCKRELAQTTAKAVELVGQLQMLCYESYSKDDSIGIELMSKLVEEFNKSGDMDVITKVAELRRKLEYLHKGEVIKGKTVESLRDMIDTLHPDIFDDHWLKETLNAINAVLKEQINNNLKILEVKDEIPIAEIRKIHKSQRGIIWDGEGHTKTTIDKKVSGAKVYLGYIEVDGRIKAFSSIVNVKNFLRTLSVLDVMHDIGIGTRLLVEGVKKVIEDGYTSVHMRILQDNLPSIGMIHKLRDYVLKRRFGEKRYEEYIRNMARESQEVFELDEEAGIYCDEKLPVAHDYGDPKLSYRYEFNFITPSGKRKFVEQQGFNDKEIDLAINILDLIGIRGLKKVKQFLDGVTNNREEILQLSREIIDILEKKNTWVYNNSYYDFIFGKKLEGDPIAFFKKVRDFLIKEDAKPEIAHLTEKILEKLVNFHSEKSGRDEISPEQLAPHERCANYIRNRLRLAGVETFEVISEKTGEKSIVGIVGDLEDIDSKTLIFDCHYDVVPIADRRAKEHYCSSIDYAGNVYRKNNAGDVFNHDSNEIVKLICGPGVYDMLGSIAALLASIENIRHYKARNNSCVFVFAPDEEFGGHYGTEIVLDELFKRYPKLNGKAKKEQIEVAILEPTNLSVNTYYRGQIRVDIEFPAPHQTQDEKYVEFNTPASMHTGYFDRDSLEVMPVLKQVLNYIEENRVSPLDLVVGNKKDGEIEPSAFNATPTCARLYYTLDEGKGSQETSRLIEFIRNYWSWTFPVPEMFPKSEFGTNGISYGINRFERVKNQKGNFWRVSLDIRAFFQDREMCKSEIEKIINPFGGVIIKISYVDPLYKAGEIKLVETLGESSLKSWELGQNLFAKTQTHNSVIEQREFFGGTVARFYKKKGIHNIVIWGPIGFLPHAFGEFVFAQSLHHMAVTLQDLIKKHLETGIQRGAPATLLKYMYTNGIYSDNPKKSKEMARQREGNDSIRTIQRELKVLKAVGLVEGDKSTGYYLADWLRGIEPEDIIRENPELNLPDPSEEQIEAVISRVKLKAKTGPSQSPRQGASSSRQFKSPQCEKAIDFYTEIGAKEGDVVVNIGSRVQVYLPLAALGLGIHYFGYDLDIDKNSFINDSIAVFSKGIETKGSARQLEKFSSDSVDSKIIADNSVDHILILTGILSEPYHKRHKPGAEEVINEVLRVIKNNGRIILGAYTDFELELEEKALKTLLPDTVNLQLLKEVSYPEATFSSYPKCKVFEISFLKENKINTQSSLSAEIIRKGNEEDIGLAEELLSNVIPAYTKEDRMYEIRYDASRLSESQQEIINTYIKLLKERVADPDNILAIPFRDKERDYIIKVTCKDTNRQILGEGQVNVDIEGELGNYPLRIIGMLNMAFATSNVENQYALDDPMIKYIKNQYRIITNQAPDSNFDIRKITLPKPARLDLNEVDRLNKLAMQVLTAA